MQSSLGRKLFQKWPSSVRSGRWVLRQSEAADEKKKYIGNMEGFMGWVEGFEPSTAGATVRSSTTELHPPCSKSILHEAEFKLALGKVPVP